MKIAFCTSEAVPFAKTGGLADVCGALPLELEALGQEVILVMPKYLSARTSGVVIRSFNEDFDLAVIGSYVRVFLLRHDMFLRQGLYGDVLGDYPDNLKRFSYLCAKALELFAKISFEPDIVHAHDWQASLLPLYIRDRRIKQPAAVKSHPRTLLTIHNMAYQGLFAKELMGDTRLGPEYFSVSGLEYYDKINLLKGGILFSDFVNTVSPTYARQVQTSVEGCGMEGVLASKRDCFVGIPNGVDYRVWNPQGDPYIFENYTISNVAGKKLNKAALQESCGLLKNERMPLLGFVGRLVEQKGVELILQVLPALAQAGAQLIVLGKGEPKYENALADAIRRFPGLVFFSSRFDDKLAHQIYAGSDIFLMPSRFEPCGIGQLISFKYGTVPVVFKTGGLVDTVTDVTENPRHGSGFVFSVYDGSVFLETIKRALAAKTDERRWLDLVRSVMRLNHSWKESARQYILVYERLRRLDS